MRGRAAAALAALLAASPAFAEGDSFDIHEARYEDWRFLAHRDGPSSAWTCIAQTGDRYDSILGLEYLAGSAPCAPTVYYLQIESDERQGRVMEPGEEIGFGIDENALVGMVGDPRPFVLEDGWHVAHRAVPLQNERALTLMMEGDAVRIGREGEPPVFTGSLVGLAAAYRKMVEICGVEKPGVVN